MSPSCSMKTSNRSPTALLKLFASGVPPSWSASSRSQSWHWIRKLVRMALCAVPATGDTIVHVPSYGGLSVDVLLLEVDEVEVVEYVDVELEVVVLVVVVVEVLVPVLLLSFRPTRTQRHLHLGRRGGICRLWRRAALIWSTLDT